MLIIYIPILAISLYIAYQPGKHRRDMEIKNILANTWHSTLNVEPTFIGGSFEILKGLSVFSENTIQEYLCNLPSDKPIIPIWVIEYVIRIKTSLHRKQA